MKPLPTFWVLIFHNPLHVPHLPLNLFNDYSTTHAILDFTLPQHGGGELPLFWVVTQRVLCNLLWTFRDNLSINSSGVQIEPWIWDPKGYPGSRSLNPADGTDRLSRNVGKKLTTIRCVLTQKNAVLSMRCHMKKACCVFSGRFFTQIVEATSSKLGGTRVRNLWHEFYEFFALIRISTHNGEVRFLLP